ILGIVARGFVNLADLLERGHERLWHITTAKIAEAAGGVGKGFGGDGDNGTHGRVNGRHARRRGKRDLASRCRRPAIPSAVASAASSAPRFFWEFTEKRISCSTRLRPPSDPAGDAASAAAPPRRSPTRSSARGAPAH